MISSFEQHFEISEAFRRRDSEAACSDMIGHTRPGGDAKGLTDYIVHLQNEVLAA